MRASSVPCPPRGRRRRPIRRREMLQGPCMRRNDDAVHQQLHVGGRQVARAYAIRGACFDKPVGVEFELLHLLDVFGLERLGLAVGQQHGLLVGGHDARVGIDGAVQARDGIFDAQQGRRHFFLVALDDVLQRQEQQVLLVRHVLVHQAGADASLLRDVLDRGGVVPHARKQLDRGLYQLRAASCYQGGVVDGMGHVGVGLLRRRRGRRGGLTACSGGLVADNNGRRVCIMEPCSPRRQAGRGWAMALAYCRCARFGPGRRLQAGRCRRRAPT
ncbi:Uncharacterised protein [Bordetella pertussis]|nr:Uncharacterised protein [Bordetella pertussis]